MKAHRNGAITVVLCLHLGIGIMAYIIAAKIVKTNLYKMLKF